MLEIKNLVKKYKSKDEENIVIALNNVSFSLPSKGMYFITGKSGCGKSTLLNIIGSIDKYDEGDILVNNKLLTDFTEKQLNNYRNDYLSFIFQDFNLLEDYNLEQNIEIVLNLQGLKNKDIKDKVNDVLEKVELTNMNKRKINELSGGQKQRVAIARALVKDSKMILCDEPTGALDSQTSKQIFELLKKISKDRLVIIVSHDKEYVNTYADGIIELSDGKIISNNIDFKKEDEKEEVFNYKKYRFPFIYKLRMALKNIRKRPIRLIIVLLLSMLCFTLFTISSIISQYDIKESLYYSLNESEVKYLSLTKQYYTDEKDIEYSSYNLSNNDVEKMKEDLNFDITTNVYRLFGNDEYNLDNMTTNLYQWLMIDRYIELTNKFIEDYDLTLYGNIPSNDNEIVITEYLFYFYDKYGYKGKDKDSFIINRYEDILNKKIYINNEEMSIVGVLDTNFDFNKFIGFDECINHYSELESINKNGLNACYYMNENYHNRHTVDIILKDEDSLYGYITNDNIDYSYVTSTIPEYLDVYYFNEKEISKMRELNDNEIIISVEGFTTQLKDYILDFSKQHFDEVKEKFIKNTFMYYADYNTYLEYIYNSRDTNIYHEGKTFEYFYNTYQEIFFEEAFKNINNNILYYNNEGFSYNKEIKVVGAIHKTNLSYTLYASHEIINEINREINKNDIIYVVTPMSKNYSNFKNTLVKSDNYFNDQKDYYFGYPITCNNCKYILYSELSDSIYNASDSLKIISNISLYISIGLLIFITLFLYYYINGIILDKKKEIGILRSFGINKKDIYQVFIIQNVFIFILTLIIAIVFSYLLINLLNNILVNKYNLDNTLIYIQLKNIILLLILGIGILLISVIFSIIQFIKKRPLSLINNI